MTQLKGSDDWKDLQFAEATADKEARAKLIAKTQRENRGRAMAKTILGLILAVVLIAICVGARMLFGD